MVNPKENPGTAKLTDAVVAAVPSLGAPKPSVGVLVPIVVPKELPRVGAVEPRVGAPAPRENPLDDEAVTDAGGAKEYGGGAEVVDAAVEDAVKPPPKENPPADAGT